MKKPIIYLGVALVAFTSVSLASNVNSLSTVKDRVEFNEITVNPFCIAVSKGDMESVKKFIEYGANVNEKSNGMTPLMFAARYNKVEVIKFLLSKGARLDEKDESGFTALKYAELSNANEAIQLLKQ